MHKFQDKNVQATFATYPEFYRKKLMVLRELIFTTAVSIKEVGPLEETLKWGEPSYITSVSRSGSTIRLAWHEKFPQQYGIYFNCNTTLIETCKEIYGDLFQYGGKRSIIFQKDYMIPVEALSECIALALTYHL